MEKEMNAKKSPHCLVLTYPLAGHINPMLQFSKRLEHKGARVTLVLTKFMKKTTKISTTIPIETISDGCDEGGIAQAESYEAHFKSFRRFGSQTLKQLLEKLSGSGHDPVDCVVYNAFLPWALDVAKSFGLAGAVFFTQSCAVGSIYYHINKGLLKVPVDSDQISIPELPTLGLSDLPSFVSDPDLDPGVLEMLADQFSNIDQADWVLCNTYYELEEKVVDWMTKVLPVRTIGPTIPSIYLDKRLEGDNHYGSTIANDNSEKCIKWLNSHPKRSVVYVSFGSFVKVKPKQIEEVACGLKRSDCHFLWVVRASESNKLPKGFVEETSEKGLVVSWCPQLEVLANDAVGCFVTHCGWNSTLEALSLGVPMVVIPQWSDQSTNGKYVMDIWKVGVKPHTDEKGIVRGEELEKCIKKIIEGKEEDNMRMNAIKFSRLAKATVDQGGTSDKNIDEFIAKIRV